MKKIIIFGSLIGLLALGSCKKDWVCQCTDQSNNTSYHDIPNATIHDADKTCNDFESNSGGGAAYNNCSVIH